MYRLQYRKHISAFLLSFIILSNINAGILMANQDNADVFLNSTSIGYSLQSYWHNEGNYSHHLRSFNSNMHHIGNETNWVNSIARPFGNTELEYGLDYYPFIALVHINGPQYPLAFIKRMTRTCIHESRWKVSDTSVMQYGSINNYNSATSYRKIVAYFPIPSNAYTNQPLVNTRIGVFLKYEQVNGIWGFWIADQGWSHTSDNKIRKHFIHGYGGSHYWDANNYRFVYFDGIC